MNTVEEHKKYNILMIDDDEQFIDDFQFLLTGPYVLTKAVGGEAGMDLLSRKPFDLVILDINMPAYFASDELQEGLEILRLIKSGSQTGIQPELPVIMLTKNDSEESIRQARQLRANAYFSKPPNVNKIRAKIDELIETENRN